VSSSLADDRLGHPDHAPAGLCDEGPVRVGRERIRDALAPATFRELVAPLA
jgi:hypothetical protein